MGTIFFFDEHYETPLQISVSAREGTPGVDVQKAILESLALENSSTELAVEGTPLAQLVWGDTKLQTGAVVTRWEKDHQDKPYVLTAIDGPDTGQSYRLARGQYSLGKGSSACLRFQDDSLKDIQEYIKLTGSGLIRSSGTFTENIELDAPFTIGNSVFRVTLATNFQNTGRRTIDLAPVEVDLPPKRQSWMYLLMVLAPLAVGVIVVAITKMWLFLIMSLASSLMMGIHWLMSKGESKKAQRIIEEACILDAQRSRSLPGLEELTHGTTFDCLQGVLVLLGNGQRLAQLEHRNIDDYRRPLVTDVPLALFLEAKQSYLLDLPDATLRAMLLALTAQPCELVLYKPHSAKLEKIYSALALLPNVRIHNHNDGHQPGSHSNRIFVVEACNWAETTIALGATDSLLVIGSLTPNHHTHFSQVLRSSGYFQEKINRLESSDKTWLCWSQGISLGTLYRAIGRRLSQQPFETPQEVATHNLSEFALSPYAQDSYYADDLVTIIGINSQGIISAGLSSDGPHWLIAGTTGSGKSELLRMMLLSLVLKYPAPRLSLSLIDFKGGATLGIFKHLPHVSNVLSDLNAESVERALRYYKTDLLAREKEFQKLGVSNYHDYLELHRAAGTPPCFPELVIVVDEFKMLVDQLPQAMNDLMKVAVIGRSLGVHLILATQRPQGAISQDIRANIALNICLRVASAQDSHNVLGSDKAASISAENPGRGYIACAGETPREFQAPLFTGLYDLNQKPTAHLANGKSSFTQRYSLNNNLAQTLVSVAESSSLPTTYCPIPPELAPTSSHKNTPRGIFYLGEAESPELAFKDSLYWHPQKDGSLTILEDSLPRTNILASLLAQAAEHKTSILIFTADLLLYERLLPALSAGKLSALVGSQDLVYCESVIDQLLSAQDTRLGHSLVVIDSLDIWIDLCTRNPDLETKLHQLLRDSHRLELAVVATSAQNLRTKTQTSTSNLLWSASAIDRDPFKKASKSFPHPADLHLVLEGEIAKGLGQDGAPTLVVSPVSYSLEKVVEDLPSTATLFAQLPLSVGIDDLDPKPAEFRKHHLYLGKKQEQMLMFPLQQGKFVPVVGKKGSGKSQLLSTIKKLNPEFSYLSFTGKAQLTVEKIDQALAQVTDIKNTILILDDLNYYDRQVQEKFISIASNFATAFVAYSPWNRWLSSPILAGLQGTTRGIALMPDQRCAELFMEFENPADLKTNGRVCPGRAVLVNDFSTIAFQVPYCAK